MAAYESGPVIRASEIGQYVYCARAWWYARVRGYPSDNVAAMQRGADRHQRHGEAVVGYHRLRQLAFFLLILAAMALGVWLLLGLGR
jgi:hypothetical protein